MARSGASEFLLIYGAKRVVESLLTLGAKRVVESLLILGAKRVVESPLPPFAKGEARSDAAQSGIKLASE